MAHLDQISPEIISKIAAIIGQRLKSLGELSRESYGGVRAVSEMFNRLDSGTSKEILEAIEQNDPKLVETIRHLMFVFEDLLLLSQEAIKEMLAQGGSQDPDGGAQGHQRTTEESYPAAHVPARRRDAAARTWTRWGRSRSRKWKRRSSRSSPSSGNWKPTGRSA